MIKTHRNTIEDVEITDVSGGGRVGTGKGVRGTGDRSKPASPSSIRGLGSKRMNGRQCARRALAPSATNVTERDG